jgi:predicted amidophosphoribosyltransferase
MPERKKCEKCENDATAGGRFCKECNKELRAEMKASGFLTRVHGRAYRSKDQQENRHETKNGRDG